MIDFDVETTSLQHHGAKPCRTFLTQFGDGGEPELIYQDDHTAVAKAQAWLDKDDDFRAHNTKFDLHCLKQQNFTLPDDSRWHDNMVAAHIIDERTSVALQNRGNKLFPDDAHPEYEQRLKAWLQDERKRRNKHAEETGDEYIEPNYSDVPRDVMDPYAANDITLTRLMGDLYYPQIKQNEDFQNLYDMEMDVMRALFWAEDRGIPMDREALVSLEAEVLPSLDTKEDRCIALSEFDGFNPRSPKQVGEALERLDADTSAMDKKEGTLVVDQENLEACDHPLAESILAYRGEQKVYQMLHAILHGPTGETGKLFPSAYLTSDDRLHPNFRQVGARTGRMSCSNPNFQQIHRDDLRMRYAVKADEGHKLIAADLDSIEMVLLAALAGEGALRDAMRRGDDIHTMTAKRVGLTGRKRSTGAVESPRQQGKRMNYLIVYGGGLRAIRKWFGVSQNRARAIYKAMQSAYPEVAMLQDRIDSKLLDRGYLECPLTHRRWRMYGSGWLAVQKEAYKFTNYLIQGTAAAIIKLAVARAHEAGVPIIAVIHDEILAHVPESDAEEAAVEIKKAMTEGFEILKSGQKLEDIIPLKADAQIIDRWSDAKEPGYVPGYMKAAA